MTFNGMSPHYNDGEIVMGAAVDMEAAAAILQVEREALTPVVAAAGRALGQARDRIAGWQANGLPPVMTFAEAKAIASGQQTVPPVHAGARVAPMDAALSAATASASASEQLLAAGDGALSVSDPVLHLGAGVPSATITGPDGSLDLRVDRLTGTPSVHLISPGFPQYGTSDPIDTQLGVNLGASVINVPDADLLAVVERAVPILDVAQGELDAEHEAIRAARDAGRVEVVDPALQELHEGPVSAGEAAHDAGVAGMDCDAIRAQGHEQLVLDQPYFGADPASTQLWGSEQDYPRAPSVEVRSTSCGGGEVTVRDGISKEKLDTPQVGERLSLTDEQAVAVVQQTGYQLRRGQAAHDSANPALTRRALVCIERDGPTAVHWDRAPRADTVQACTDRPAIEQPSASGPGLQGTQARSVDAHARAAFEAGGSAVTDALARLHAPRPARATHQDRAHYARGGPSIR